VLTLLLPAIMAGAFIIPAKLSSMKSAKAQRLVVVTSTPQFGEIVRQQLVAGDKTDDEKAGADTGKDIEKDKDIGEDNEPSRNYSIEAVSYTHLDVYKRQIEQRNESLPVVVNAEGHLEIEATLHGRSSVVG